MASLRNGFNLEKGGVISLVGAGGKTALMFRIARELAKSGDTVLTTTTTKIYMPTRKQSPWVILSESGRTLVKQAKTFLKINSHISAGAGQLNFQHKLKGLRPEIIDYLWRSNVFRWIIVEADGAAGKPLKAPALHEPVVPRSTKWIIGVVGLSAVRKPLTENWVFRPKLFANLSGLAIGSEITEEAIAAALMHEDGIMKCVFPEAMRLAFLNQADSHARLKAGKRIAQLLMKSKEKRIKRVVVGQTLYAPPVAAYYDLNS
jgi:probable selenium-dependent hydroxylase accessory protein YqeC